jgi:hypothetical protein
MSVSFQDGGFATTGKETGASECIRRLPECIRGEQG